MLIIGAAHARCGDCISRAYITIRPSTRLEVAALLALLVTVFIACAAPARAALITSTNIIPVPTGTVGSGNGTLDFIFLTESSGGSQNSSGPFNGDDANTQMPTGTGNTTSNESFITSIGEIRSFYVLNFPNGSGGSTVNQLVVMVDVNETGGPQSINLDTFDIIHNFTAFAPPSDTRNDPLNNDLSSSTQNGTNASFSGGTVLATLDSSPKVLAQVSVGAGHADQAIFTGINPFDPSFADSDRIVLHWVSSDHDNGGETVFLSGSIAGADIFPEPGVASIAALGLIGLARRRQRHA
jgi:hypothetical protein